MIKKIYNHIIGCCLDHKLEKKMDDIYKENNKINEEEVTILIEPELNIDGIKNINYENFINISESDDYVFIN